MAIASYGQHAQATVVFGITQQKLRDILSTRNDSSSNDNSTLTKDQFSVESSTVTDVVYAFVVSPVDGSASQRYVHELIETEQQSLFFTIDIPIEGKEYAQSCDIFTSLPKVLRLLPTWDVPNYKQSPQTD